MNIIEKLGITPGPWKYDKRHEFIESERDGQRICYEASISKDGALIAAAPEMLEALIEDIESYEFSPGDMHSHYDYIRNKKIVEKATGKTWEEIKELIKK